MIKNTFNTSCILIALSLSSCNEQPDNQKNPSPHQTQSTTETITNTFTKSNTDTDLMTDTILSTDTDLSTNTNSESQTDTDTNLITYADQNISDDDALARITNGSRLINPHFMKIDDSLKDWQILDLTAYAMQIFDLSQQGHFISVENYDIDLDNEIELLNAVITNKITGFTQENFKDLSNLQDLCNIALELTDTPISMNIEGDVRNDLNATERNAKVRMRLAVSICQYNYKEDMVDREQYVYGDLSYDNFKFRNSINSDLSETTESIVSQVHGQWLVLSSTMGYQNSLGYWYLENFNSVLSYDNLNIDEKVKTTNFSVDLILRDGFINFDHRYIITQPDDQIILNHLGAKNPHAGTIEISTVSEKKLIIKFSEDSVDIYINEELRLDNVSWTDIRARKLDMTFNYVND
ncbi:hypothetical protein [Marinicellulosiphila megalodicopiae]|uniref:hypothetical protein n=1 Tax=Marinicellulosiphila megalodicopiae TaxID=2724896 RepID=UPI003BB06709